MTTLTQVAALLAAAVIATGSANLPGQNPTPQTPTTQKATAPVIALIGCVERVMPAPGQPADPAAKTPTYKLIDVQPGPGTQRIATPNAEYVLAGPTTIEFGKFQNQWVEVTGTIAPPKPTTMSAQTGTKEKPAAALPTFTATALKVVSSECK